MALEIENYALIGDCETAALVGKNGSIDWLCWPDFSSPACFAALLGTEQNGRWLLAPKKDCKRITRRYRDHTLILETRFETASGILLVTDFMPVRETHSDIVRIATCLEGKVAVQMELCVRFDYGCTIPWTGARERNAWAAAAGTGIAYLRTQQSIGTKNEIASVEINLAEGEHRSFVLTDVGAQASPPRRINAQKALWQTEKYWREWCASNTYKGEWQEAVERSLITLKALTYRPTGGIVAAPTTSLPERLGETEIGTIATAGCGMPFSRSNRYSRLAITTKLGLGKTGFFKPLAVMCETCKSCMACGANDIYQNASYRGYKDIEGPSRYASETQHRNNCSWMCMVKYAMRL